MKLIGNLLWFILVGFWGALFYLVAGLLLCVTIIGIPFGIQCIKIAMLVVWPFGKSIHSNFGKHPIINIIWCLFLGWEIAIGYLVAGLILTITVIGIPFGKQCFKIMQLSFVPFGADID